MRSGSAQELVEAAEKALEGQVPAAALTPEQELELEKLKKEAKLRRLALDPQPEAVGDAKSSLGDAESSLGDAKSSLGDTKSSLGDAKSSLGDAESSLGDAKSSLGGAESSLGDAKSSLGESGSCATPSARISSSPRTFATTTARPSASSSDRPAAL